MGDDLFCLSPSLNLWYSVELHWLGASSNGLGELYVDGELVCSVQGTNTAAFDGVNFILFGLAELYHCGATLVYGDDFEISKTYIGSLPSFDSNSDDLPPWDLNQDGKVDIIDLSIIANSVGLTPESENWNPKADLNGDEKINILDMVTLVMHYGEEYT